MRGTGLVAWLLFVPLLAACSSSGGAASVKCQETKSYNGIGVYFEPGALRSSNKVAVTGCVDQACRTIRMKASPQGFFIPVPSTPSDAPVQVRIKARSASGAELFDGTTSTHSIKILLHARGCSPRAARVNVIAHRDGTLTPTP
jgi:hypothetical protein